MRKSDYILIAVLLCLAAIGWIFFHSQGQNKNKILIVQLDQTIIDKIDLNTIQGEVHRTIKVPDGTLEYRYDKSGAWIESSPCPDKICLHQGKITKTGDSIACVPEKVLLLLELNKKEATEDAILR